MLYIQAPRSFWKTHTLYTMYHDIDVSIFKMSKICRIIFLLYEKKMLIGKVVTFNKYTVTSKYMFTKMSKCPLNAYHKTLTIWMVSGV